ncbi:metallo proteinase 10 [Pholiota conissans]|uniref:Extracellular metalloproteinase n=1 Tax=Pholiota conissans TaxID=109636 RepID=A0A9P5ZGU1_9AGAR|nr:metallo proteinase 10 [Pholiota conissans]
MVAFTNSFFTLILAALLTTYVEAAPWPVYKRHGTHRVRSIGKRGLTVSTYHPKNTFKTFSGPDAPSAAVGNFAKRSLGDTAKSFLSSELGISEDNVEYKSGYTEGSTRVAFVKQSINGIPLANSVANIAFNGDKVVSYGSSFVDTNSSKIASPEPTVGWRSVLSTIEDNLDAKYNDHNATLEYLVQSDGSISLTHVIQVQNQNTSAWYEAYIDAHSGDLLSVTDFVADASYTVVPVERLSFSEGTVTLVDPQNLQSSPFGWHSDGTQSSTSTTGNNVAASIVGKRPVSQTSRGLNFNAQYDDTLDPTVTENQQAAVVNGFYVLNVMHDFTYLYGFTEANFNFQLGENTGKTGGQQGDPVVLRVQDPSGVNNANFATPPDGQSGVCSMFLWDITDVRRDGAMETDIIIHEMTHGITNRLTGGGTARCLQTLEAGGLGEGWGDAMANWMNQNSTQTRDFAMAAYVANTAEGIRQFPYSTDPNVNPLSYSDLRNANEVHAIGEVWANMLHNVYAALVDSLGFDDNKLTNPNGSAGNIVFMRLFLDSLALQPCNPTFVETRDAWLTADANRFNGKNKCTLQTAFASRGLGLGADDNFVNDSTVDPEC